MHKQAPIRNDLDMIESASVTALMRYIQSNEANLAKNPDNLGIHFINGKWKKYLNDVKSSKVELQRKLPGCIYYHLIRTKFFDDALIKWVNNNKDSQILILGTGFDTRALRFKEILEDSKVTVYEVDLKAMLEFKDKIIKGLGCKLKNLKYVPCNFQKDNVIDKLVENGFDLNKPTIVLWEGVTYFLTKKIFDKYLELFRKNCKSKLHIAFDYAFRDYIEGNLNFYGAKELYDILIEIGEPHLFGLNYNEVEEYCNRKGFLIKNNYTSLMLEALYLKDPFGNSVGMPHVFNGMAEIIKKTE